MTGIGWLDWLGVVVFGLLAALSAARLGLGWRSISDRIEVVQHGVMAAGMAAMSWPGSHLLSPVAGMVTFAVAGSWALQLLVRRMGPWRGLDRRGVGGPWWRRSGGAAHHLAASLVMIVAFGGGHAGYGGQDVVAAAGATPPTAGHDMASHDMDHDMAGHDMAGHDMDMESASVAGTTSTHGTGHQEQLPAAVDDMVETAIGWPIWPVAGVAFVVYALWVAMGRADEARCGCATSPAASRDEKTILSRLRGMVLAPLLERWCAVVMAAGMGVMTFAI
jgi:hypothetical protein